MRTITISRRLLRRAILGAALVAVLLAGLHWRPSRQVRLHQRDLLRAVEDRKWPTVGEFFAPDYRDRWGQTKPQILERLPQIFADFLALGVLAENETFSRQDGAPVIREHLRLVGSGGPIAQFVIQESAHLTAPFSFKWRRESWKPWDWALVEVDQPQLEAPANVDPGL